MKNTCVFLLPTMLLSTFIFAQPQRDLEHELYRAGERKADEIRQKYAPDTVAFVRTFLDNVPTMIKRLREKEKEIEIKDSVAWRLYTHRLNSNPRNAFEYGVQKLYDELSTGNLENVNGLLGVMVRYNTRVANSVILRDSLTVYLIASFASFRNQQRDLRAIRTLYYTADYETLRTNSDVIMRWVNSYLSMQNEFKQLKKWWDNEHYEAGIEPLFERVSWYHTLEADYVAVALRILLSSEEERAKLAKDTVFLKERGGGRLYLRAALGDTEAEDELIEEYRNETTFNGRREILRQLLFVNSHRSITAALEGFSDEIYDHPCSASVRVSIINQLSRLYPDEEKFRRLTETDILDGTPTYPFTAGTPFTSGTEPDWVAEYVESILSWMKESFNVIPSGGNKTLRLQKYDRGGCRIGVPIFHTNRRPRNLEQMEQVEQ
jgi:hypothetical protein